MEVRQQLAAGLGHQAGFLGHISVELLMDAVLIERQPGLVDQYYRMLDALDHSKLQVAANKICKSPVSNLVILLPRFIQERFLADYPDNGCC